MVAIRASGCEEWARCDVNTVAEVRREGMKIHTGDNDKLGPQEEGWESMLDGDTENGEKRSCNGRDSTEARTASFAPHFRSPSPVHSQNLHPQPR